MRWPRLLSVSPLVTTGHAKRGDIIACLGSLTRPPVSAKYYKTFSSTLITLTPYTLSTISNKNGAFCAAVYQ